jgi:hypothetical protein
MALLLLKILMMHLTNYVYYFLPTPGFFISTIGVSGL